MTGRVKLLGGIVLAVVWGWILWQWAGSGPEEPAETVKEQRLPKRKQIPDIPTVELARLERSDDAAAPAGRDLFAYYVPPPPPPPAKTPQQLADEEARRRAAEEARRRAEEERREQMANQPPPPPPPPPPIQFKFEGFVEKGGVKYAILKDEDGVLHVGKEGDTVAYRYKVLKIGHESIDMGYVDNPGRQQIELSGS